MSAKGSTATGPLTPTLAAKCRNPNRQSPQTPRLANTATISRGTSTISSASTPVERRVQVSLVNSESPKSDASVAGKEKNVSSTSPKKTPTATTTAATLLGSNITPRSSARRLRTDSNKSTPTNTPTGPPTPGPATAKERAVGISSYGKGQEPKPRNMINGDRSSKSDIVSNRPKLHLAAAPSSLAPATPSSASPVRAKDSARFFHASDAGKGLTSQMGHNRPALKKAATFFYANGAQETTALISSRSVSPTLSAVEREAPPLSKFCYVDEAKGSRSIISSPPSLTSSPASSVFASPTQPFPSLRPPSPLKENIHLSYRKGVSQVIKPSCHRLSAASLPVFAGHSTPTNDKAGAGKGDSETESKRRMSSPSSSASQQITHVKRSSLSSIDSGTPNKRPFHNNRAQRESVTSIDAIEASPHSSSVSPRTVNIVEQSKGNDQNETEESQLQPDVKQFTYFSPSILTGPGDQHAITANKIRTSGPDLAELAANARRERKVLDLEISNSSLLAINRQLEREVRRQKVELRRFRRLSRAGHIPIGRASSLSFAGKRCISCSTAVTDSNELSENEPDGQRYDDCDADEHEFGDSEDDEDEEDTSVSDISSIASISNPYSNGRLARDERRLRLDLSKHRELLVDSQKLNQGLKRCIDWTEELVRDGRRALDYKVRVSDVKLGGRVLRCDDDWPPEDEIEVRDGLENDVVDPDTRAADGHTDHGGGLIDNGLERTEAGTNAVCGVDSNVEEIASGGPLLSPWRSQAGSQWPQQYTAPCMPSALTAVSDYFGTEAFSGASRSDNTAPA